MTYQEIQDRLSKCETILSQIKDGTLKNMSPEEIQKLNNKVEVLRESLVKKALSAKLKTLSEAEETMFVATKGGETKAVAMDRKQAADLKKDSNITSIDTAKGQKIKEEEGIEFSVEETKVIAKEVGKALIGALREAGDQIDSVKAHNIEPNSFDIYVKYKNDFEDDFSFYISGDTLHLVDYSFDKEIGDVGVKPSGEAIVHVDVIKNNLLKHFQAMNEDVNEELNDRQKYLVLFDMYKKEPDGDRKERIKKALLKQADKYGIKLQLKEAPEGMFYIEVAIRDARQAIGILDDKYSKQVMFNGSNVYYFSDEQTAYDVLEDFGANDIEVLDTNLDLFAEEKGKKTNEGEGDDHHYIKVPRAQYKKAMSILNNNVEPSFAKMKTVDNDGAGNVVIYFIFRHEYGFDPMYDDPEGLENPELYQEPDEDIDGFMYDAVKDLQAHGIDVQDHSAQLDEENVEEGHGRDDLDIGHQDDEPDMLKQYAYDIATYAAKLYKQLDKYDKMDAEVDFPNWWQAKVILSREYISKAQHYLEFEEKQPAIDQLALEEGKVGRMIGAGLLTLATVAGLGKVAAPSKSAMKDTSKLVQVNDTMKLALANMSDSDVRKLGQELEDAGVRLKQPNTAGLMKRQASSEEFDAAFAETYKQQIETLMKSGKYSENFVITSGGVSFVANPGQITPVRETVNEAVTHDFEERIDQIVNHYFNGDPELKKAAIEYASIKGARVMGGRSATASLFKDFYNSYSDEVANQAMEVIDMADDDVYFERKEKMQEAQPTGFGTGQGRSKTISKGTEKNPELKATLKAQEPKKPGKYVMKNGIPHKMVNGKLVPLTKVVKEYTERSFSGAGLIDKVSQNAPDMFAKKVFADILPNGVASEDEAVKALQAHDKSGIKKRMGEHAPMFVHVQYHELDHDGERYRLHQTQYFNSKFDDKDPNFNPRVTQISLTKVNDPDRFTKNTENLGSILVKTDAYVEDLRNLPGLGDRVSEVVKEEKATCCGKCGRVHVKGTKCKRPFLTGKDHCRNN